MFRKYDIPFGLDTVETTLRHREILHEKAFLKRLYRDWYSAFADRSRAGKGGKHLEIGSGGGFLKDLFPEVITSDILHLPNIDLVCSAESLPFQDNELASIMLLNVFHHIPNPHLFLLEAQRTLRPSGKIIMIEPANSFLGRVIYKKFHHEPFDEMGAREIAHGKPLSNSNQALPYIYFERDRELFRDEYSRLRIESIKYHSPLSYIISGGFSRGALLPAFMYHPVRTAERLLTPFSNQLGLFCTVRLEKRIRGH